MSSDCHAQIAKLASLERDVLHNRKVVEQQRTLVYALHTQGRAAGQSLVSLAKFERTLAVLEKDFEELQKEINKLSTLD